MEMKEAAKRLRIAQGELRTITTCNSRTPLNRSPKAKERKSRTNEAPVIQRLASASRVDESIKTLPPSAKPQCLLLVGLDLLCLQVLENLLCPRE